MTTQSQDIFKAFGSNWKWASLTGCGTARIHTEQPTINGGVIFYNSSEGKISRCEAFDICGSCDAQIWERTDFTSGPSYQTDCFGIPLPQMPQAQLPAAYGMLVASGGGGAGGRQAGATVCVPTGNLGVVMGAPTQQAPVAVVRLTTDEAENGGLWKFAKADEVYVLVSGNGNVFFGDERTSALRLASDVVVDGVTFDIEHQRILEVTAPEAGKPFTPVDVAKVNDDTEAEDDAHGWSDGGAELEQKLKRQRRVYKKAKAQAWYLVVEGHLSSMQYVAIFGELPK